MVANGGCLVVNDNSSIMDINRTEDALVLSVDKLVVINDRIQAVCS